MYMYLCRLASLGFLFGAAAFTGDGSRLLEPADGDPPYYFGEDVAIDGATVVVGAPLDGDNGMFSGAAYMFDARTGEQLFKLAPDVVGENRRFGRRVAVWGDTALVAAWSNDQLNVISENAYLFDVRSGQQVGELTPGGGANGSLFGCGVSIWGNTALVGACWDSDNGPFSGAAYVFDVDTGEQRLKLLADDGEPGDDFGIAVAVWGSTAVVGSRARSEVDVGSGAAYIYNVNTGRQLHKLLPSDPQRSAQFGLSVAVSGTRALVAAPLSDQPEVESGAVYVFDTVHGLETAKLVAPDGDRGDQFGSDVALVGSLAVIGADGDDDGGNNAGAVYLFDLDTGDLVTKFVRDDTRELGRSVSVSDVAAVLGAPTTNDPAGSAYVIGLPACPAVGACRADWDNNGIVNAADVGAYLSAYFQDALKGTVNADFDCNDEVNAADVGAYLSEYFAAPGPCP